MEYNNNKKEENAIIINHGLNHFHIVKQFHPKIFKYAKETEPVRLVK